MVTNSSQGQRLSRASGPPALASWRPSTSMATASLRERGLWGGAHGCGRQWRGDVFSANRSCCLTADATPPPKNTIPPTLLKMQHSPELHTSPSQQHTQLPIRTHTHTPQLMMFSSQAGRQAQLVGGVGVGQRAHHHRAVWRRRRAPRGAARRHHSRVFVLFAAGGGGARGRV